MSENVLGVMREFENPLSCAKGCAGEVGGGVIWRWKNLDVEDMEGEGGSRPGSTASLRGHPRLGGVHPCGRPEVLLLVCVALKAKNRTLHPARQSLTQAVVSRRHERKKHNNTAPEERWFPAEHTHAP